jgi:hypothetical protein
MSKVTFLESISLRPCQLEHLKRLLFILRSSPVAFDLTPMGHGKTFIAGGIIEAWEYEKVFVVCPALLELHWRAILSGNGSVLRPTAMKTFTIISYETLHGLIRAGEEGIAISHPYLTAQVKNATTSAKKERSPNIRTPSNVEYEATDVLKELCQARTLFIFDEIHKTKNIATNTHASVATIIKTIRAAYPIEDNMSRAVLLSGTIFDSAYYAVNTMVMIGIMNSHLLTRYDRILRTFHSTGLSELINYCHYQVKNLTLSDPVGDYGQGKIRTQRDAEQVAYTTIVQEIMPSLSSSIKIADEKGARRITRRAPLNPSAYNPQEITITDTASAAERELSETHAVVKMALLDQTVGGGPGANLEIELDCKNLFVHLTPENTIRLHEMMTSLSATTSKVTATHRPSKLPAPLSIPVARAKHHLTAIETLKREVFVKYAIKKITEHPYSKVVIAVNFLETVDWVTAQLRAHPLLKDCVRVLTGKITSKKVRDTIVTDFQANTGTVRVIVAITRVIAIGLSLDDQYGEGEGPGTARRRFVFVSPSFFAIDQHQFIRRFYRADTKSSPFIRFIYGKPYKNTREDKASVILSQRVGSSARVISALASRAIVIRSTTPANAVDSIMYSDEIPSEHEQSEPEP